jgi:hypothetical protein
MMLQVAVVVVLLVRMVMGQQETRRELHLDFVIVVRCRGLRIRGILLALLGRAKPIRAPNCRWYSIWPLSKGGTCE